MCLIIHKPEGKKIKKVQNYKGIIDYHSDGIGYAYRAKGKIYFKKGITKDQAENFFRDIGTLAGTLHFRQATSGGVSTKLCHPFPLTNDETELLKTEGTAQAVLFHNGILSGYGGKKLSDTAEFTLLLADSVNDKTVIKDRKLIQQEIGSSKILIMTVTHTLFLGSFIKDDGLYYSNDSYKWFKLGNNYFPWYNPKKYIHHKSYFRESFRTNDDYNYCNSLYDNDENYYQEQEQDEDKEDKEDREIKSYTDSVWNDLYSTP